MSAKTAAARRLARLGGKKHTARLVATARRLFDSSPRRTDPEAVFRKFERARDLIVARRDRGVDAVGRLTFRAQPIIRGRVPRRLYHGTSANVVPDILKHGLPPGSYFTPRLDIARAYAMSRSRYAHGKITAGMAATYLGRSGGDPIIISVPLSRVRRRDLTLDSDVINRPHYAPFYAAPLRTKQAAFGQARNVRDLRPGGEIKNWRLTARYLGALRSKRPVRIAKGDLRRVGKGGKVVRKTPKEHVMTAKELRAKAREWRR